MWNTLGAHVCDTIAFRGLKWVAKRLWTEDFERARSLEDDLLTCGPISVCRTACPHQLTLPNVTHTVWNTLGVLVCETIAFRGLQWVACQH